MRNTVVQPLLLLALLLLGLIPQVQASKPIILPPDSYNQSITRYIAILEDESGELTTADVLKTENQLRFMRIHTRYLKRGMTDSTFWLQLSLHNPTAETRTTALSLSNPRLDVVDIIDVTNPDAVQPMEKKHLRATRPQAHSYLFQLEGHSTSRFLIRLQTDALLNTSIELKSLDQFIDTEQRINIITGTAIGWVMAACWYFAYAWLRNRHRFSLMSLMFCFSVVVFIPAWMGLLHTSWGFSESLNSFLETAAICVIAIFHLLAILNLHWPRKFVRQIILVLTLPFLILLTGDLWLSTGFMEMSIGLSIAFGEGVLMCVLWFAHSTYRQAQMYLFAGVMPILTGVILTLLNNANMLPLDVLNEWMVVSLAFVGIMSLILADHNINHSDEDSRGQSAPHGIPPALLTQISDELRTPINGVTGMYELISDTPLSPIQRDYVDTMSLAGKDMLIMAQEIADLARLQTEHFTIEYKPVSTADLIVKSVAHFQQEAHRKKVEIVVDTANDFPPRVKTDASRLQVLTHHMMTQLLAYTENGELSVYLSYYEGPKKGIRIQFRLSGHISRHESLKEILRILKSETPVNWQETPRLWNQVVVRDLLHMMNATLDLEEISTRSGSVTLFVPAEPVDFSQEEEDRDDNLNGLRILIVDDNASLRSVLEKRLRLWGVIADSTYSGKEALAMMRNQSAMAMPYDFIIIDHDMPMMSGLQLCERLRSDDEIMPKPASLMLTGLSVSATENAARQAGFVKTIAKPVSGNRLREALVEILSQRRHSRRVRPNSSSEH